MVHFDAYLLVLGINVVSNLDHLAVDSVVVVTSVSTAVGGAAVGVVNVVSFLFVDANIVILGAELVVNSVKSVFWTQ